MNILINILYKNISVAETLKWSIEFASEKNVICEIAHHEDAVNSAPSLLLTDAASFNRLYERDKQPPCPVILLTTNMPDDFELAEALYKGVDAIADISEGPAITLAKIQNLLENKNDETQQVLLKMIQNSRIKNNELNVQKPGSNLANKQQQK